jgi:ABC-type phosphate transport system substrate-binding protein
VRIVRSLVAMGAVAATATALAVAPALADPVNSHFRAITPQPYDVVGVGSATTQNMVNALSVAYNKTVKHHNSTHPFILSWDATPPHNPNLLTQQIRTKAGCPKNLRPDGSSAGIKALGTAGTVKFRGKTYPCVNFARSSRAFSATSGDPVFGPGGVSFTILAKDAVTYATTANSNVPNNLTTAQLSEIFGCQIPAKTYPLPGGGTVSFPEGTWGALLGPNAKNANGSPAPVLPQAGSGTLSFWTGDLGIGTNEPTCGPAVSIPTTKDPEENEGIDNIFRVGDVASGKPNPDVIYPFSIGSYIAQQFHSPKPGKKPGKGQNHFGNDFRGVLHLNELNGTQPTATAGSGKSKHVTINPKFSAAFQRFVYNVVPFSTDKTHIPASLEKWFDPANVKGAPHGFFCEKGQNSIIEDYGFLPTPLCGLTS